MRIAVTYDDGQIFQHFGHTERFKVYDIENNEIKVTSIINNNGNGHGALASILANDDVNILICGGIGGGAKDALAEANIKLYGGVQGDADKAVKDYLAGKLSFDSDIKCNHHNGHHHGGEGHSCGRKC